MSNEVSTRSPPTSAQQQAAGHGRAARLATKRRTGGGQQAPARFGLAFVLVAALEARTVRACVIVARPCYMLRDHARPPGSCNTAPGP